MTRAQDNGDKTAANGARTLLEREYDFPEIDSSRIAVRYLDLLSWDAEHPVDVELVRAHAKQW
jgi:hypothetical protein